MYETKNRRRRKDAKRKESKLQRAGTWLSVQHLLRQRIPSREVVWGPERAAEKSHPAEVV